MTGLAFDRGRCIVHGVIHWSVRRSEGFRLLQRPRALVAHSMPLTRQSPTAAAPRGPCSLARLERSALPPARSVESEQGTVPGGDIGIRSDGAASGAAAHEMLIRESDAGSPDEVCNELEDGSVHKGWEARHARRIHRCAARCPLRGLHHEPRPRSAQASISRRIRYSIRTASIFSRVNRALSRPLAIAPAIGMNCAAVRLDMRMPIS